MKNKTNFKQMYLVDEHVFKKINNDVSSSTPIILKNYIAEPALNQVVSTPTNSHLKYHSQHDVKSIGSIDSQSNLTQVKTIGTNTNTSSKVCNHSQTTPEESRNNNELINNQNVKMDNKNAESDNDGKHPKLEKSSHYFQSSQRTQPGNLLNNHESNSNQALQYIIPDPQFQRDIMNLSANPSIQNTNSPMLTQEENMDITTDEAPQSRCLTNSSHNEKMDLTCDSPNQHLAIDSSLHPQIDLQQNDYRINTPTSTSTYRDQAHREVHSIENIRGPHPAIQSIDNISIEDISTKKSVRANKRRRGEDCENCSISTYQNYDVSLPFKTGLPDGVTFICLLCESKFSSKEALKRHVKNIHDAFTQVEKGIKRKCKQNEAPSKRMKTSKKRSSYLKYT